MLGTQAKKLSRNSVAREEALAFRGSATLNRTPVRSRTTSQARMSEEPDEDDNVNNYGNASSLYLADDSEMLDLETPKLPKGNRHLPSASPTPTSRTEKFLTTIASPFRRFSVSGPLGRISMSEISQPPTVHGDTGSGRPPQDSTTRETPATGRPMPEIQKDSSGRPMPGMPGSFRKDPNCPAPSQDVNHFSTSQVHALLLKMQEDKRVETATLMKMQEDKRAETATLMALLTDVRKRLDEAERFRSTFMNYQPPPPLHHAPPRDPPIPLAPFSLSREIPQRNRFDFTLDKPITRLRGGAEPQGANRNQAPQPPPPPRSERSRRKRDCRENSQER